jgi:hypothetical protein
MNRIPVLLLLILVSILSSSLVAAEDNGGTVSGFVVNHSTQERLPSANIQVLGTQRGAATDAEGRFTIKDLQAGTYQLRISLVGYQTRLLSDIVVASGRAVELDIEMMQASVDLEAVEVTGTYFRNDPSEAVSTQRLTYEEIRRAPGGFEDVVRAISVLPGVAQAQPGRNDLVVRGGAPSENLYVVDNIQIPNINHFGTQGAGGGPLSYINLDFVKETSFSTGGFGVRYGDRLSSVLTIDLQDGRSDRIGGKATISATQFGLDCQGPLGERGTFVLSARRSYLDLIFKAAGFSFVPEYYDFLGRATYSLDGVNKLTFVGIGAIDNVRYFNNTSDDRFENSRILGTDQQQYASGLSWRHLMGSGYATVTLGQSLIHYNGAQRDSLLRPIFTNTSRESETSLRGDMVFQLASTSELSFGADVERVRFNTRLALPAYVTTFGDTINVHPTDVSTIGYKAAGYVQISHRILDHFVFTGGVRLDYFSLIDHQQYLAPRGSLTYEISDLTSAAASVGTYYQNPSYVWLATSPANSALKAARVDQYILGIEHLFRADLKARVEGFLKKYTDYPASTTRRYLVLSNTGGGYGGADENFDSYGLGLLTSGGSGEARGVEFTLQKKLSEIPLYALVSLTISKTIFRALDGVEHPGSYDQELIFNISGGYHFDEKWECSAKFRYASGQPYTPFNPDGTQNVSAYNSARVKSAHSLDVRVDRRWNFSSWNLIAYVDIQNIYNNRFSGGVRWNAREKKVETNENAIGILPSIGVSAEF